MNDWEAPATDAYVNAPDSSSGNWKAPESDLIAPTELESFGRAAANNFPLAPQAIAGLSPGDYSKNLADWKAKAETAKEVNPKSYAAGAVTGAIAPAFIPYVGEAIAANPVLSNAALGAASGISDVDLKQHPIEALKEGAIGAGTGAAVGKIGKAVMPVEGAQQALEDNASNIAAEGLNLPPKLLGNLEDQELTNYGRFAQEHDLLNQDTSKALKNARTALSQIGTQIGETGAQSAPLEESGPYVQSLMEKAEAIKKLAAPGAAQDVAAYERGAQDIAENGKTFQDLQNLKSYYGPKAFDVNHQVKDQAMADVYGQIKKAMNDIIANAPEEYQKQLADYTMAHDAVQGLTRKLGAERQGYVRGPIGFMGRIIGKLPGQSKPWINVPTATAIGATTSPYLGAMAVSPTLTNPAVQSGALQTIANTLPKARQGIDQAIVDYLLSEREKRQ